MKDKVQRGPSACRRGTLRGGEPVALPASGAACRQPRFEAE